MDKYGSVLLRKVWLPPICSFFNRIDNTLCHTFCIVYSSYLTTALGCAADTPVFLFTKLPKKIATTIKSSLISYYSHLDYCALLTLIRSLKIILVTESNQSINQSEL